MAPSDLPLLRWMRCALAPPELVEYTLTFAPSNLA